MSFNIFTKEILFTVGSNTYLIPIWNMSVRSGPYAREVGEGTAIKAFDGRSYQVHQGWRSRCTLDWPEMTVESQKILYDMLVDLISTGVATVNFNPSSTAQTINMILEDPADALQAVFQNNARNRPGRLSLISQNISSSSPPWITDDIESDTIMWISTNGNFFVTSADLSTTVEPNPSLDLSFLVSGNSKQLELDQNTGTLWTIQDGVVYSWQSDGSGFGTAFTTAFVDMQGLVLDWKSGKMALTAHEINFANHRWKLYNYAGTQIHDEEFRAGLATLEYTTGQFHNGTGLYLYNNDGAILTMNDIAHEDGLGALSHIISNDLCIDEESDIVYHLSSPGIFYQSASVQATGTPGSNDTFLSNVPNNSKQIDIYEYNEIKYLIGGGSDSFRVQNNGTNLIEDWVPSGESIHLLCTRRPTV